MKFRFLLGIGAMFLPTVAGATNWRVILVNEFSPNDLTIQVGDFVHWQGNAGPHNITSDNYGMFSGFSSGTRSGAFHYLRSFGREGVFLYHCSVHSSPGKDIASNENGRITVISSPLNDADLALQSLDAQNGTYAPGDTIPVSISIKNLGTDPPASQSIYFYASVDSTIDSQDIPIGSDTRGGAVPGGMSNFVTHPMFPNNMKAGSYFIGGRISLIDTDQTNNTLVDPTPVTVTVPPGNINGSKSGAWYDPTREGEGFLLEVKSIYDAVVYWFTYDNEGKQRWMFGTGVITGSKIHFAELQTTSGGKFGPDFDPADVHYSTWGKLDLEFTSCDRATATYRGPAGFGSGSMNLQRLSRIWGENCDGSNSMPLGTGIGNLNPGFSGSWYDYHHEGEGFSVEILDEETALIYWFTYDTQGNQAWMIGLGQIEGSSILAQDVQITSGGNFGLDFDPHNVVFEHWGEATFTLEHCENSGDRFAGSMNYVPPPDFGPQSTQSLDRLTHIVGMKEVCIAYP